MRIEPKTFFANERTFLTWLHMAVTIGTIAAALLGFSGTASRSDKPSYGVCTFSSTTPLHQNIGLSSVTHTGTPALHELHAFASTYRPVICDPYWHTSLA